MKRFVVSVLAALTALTTVVGLAGPASADRMVHRDARGDVVSIDLDTGAETPAPSVTQGDVTRARVAHRSRSVVLKLTFAALQRRAMHAEIAMLMTPSSAGSLVVQADRETGWQGEAWFAYESSDRTCPRMRHRIDYDRNTIRVVVPRRCLERPRWVRVGIGLVRESDQGFFADDALRVGIRDDLALTRKLYRG